MDTKALYTRIEEDRKSQNRRLDGEKNAVDILTDLLEQLPEPDSTSTWSFMVNVNYLPENEDAAEDRRSELQLIFHTPATREIDMYSGSLYYQFSRTVDDKELVCKIQKASLAKDCVLETETYTGQRYKVVCAPVEEAV